MRNELKLGGFTALAFLIGMLAGAFSYQQTLQAKLVFAEFKRITTINQLLEIKQQEILKSLDKSIKQ